MPPMMRRIFWYLNKYFMVPIFRLGLGSIFCNPLAGYIMVMKTIGRKSGKTYFTPVNYAIHKGNVYCISGGRRASDWFRNVMAHPEIEIILPGGAIFARAEEVNGPDEKLALTRQVFINAGFAGFFEGFNPRSISDKELQGKIVDLPLLRFQPLGLGSGPVDPTGWAWIWAIVITIAIIWGLAVVL
jgi:deazaflavin-dependent oxidoreductase (nitroreductase family)